MRVTVGFDTIVRVRVLTRGRVRVGPRAGPATRRVHMGVMAARVVVRIEGRKR